MRTRLLLFLDWGITFEEPYTVPEKSNRGVAYANRVDLERNLPKSPIPEPEPDEAGTYAVPPRGGVVHAPASDKRVRKPSPYNVVKTAPLSREREQHLQSLFDPVTQAQKRSLSARERLRLFDEPRRGSG